MLIKDILNCFGATDGKHITLLKPKHSGSYFYNYKGLVLLALLFMIIIFIMIIVFWQLMLEFKVELVMVVFFKNSEMYFALEIIP